MAGEDSISSEKFEGYTWSQIQQPPVSGYHYHNYAVVFHDSIHYYFGGYRRGAIGLGNNIGSIFALKEKTWKWSKLGKMKTSRSGHRVIKVGERFTIVGGGGNKNNEDCLLNDGKFICSELPSKLKNYNKPILHLVDEKFTANHTNC